MAKLSKRYFIIDGQHAFIPTEEVGIFVMVHPCILFVSCKWCDAREGERCKGYEGRLWTSSTHYVRREDGARLVRESIRENQKIGRLP